MRLKTNPSNYAPSDNSQNTGAHKRLLSKQRDGSYKLPVYTLLLLRWVLPGYIRSGRVFCRRSVSSDRPGRHDVGHSIRILSSTYPAGWGLCSIRTLPR
jgi:hypothetical protein